MSESKKEAPCTTTECEANVAALRAVVTVLSLELAALRAELAQARTQVGALKGIRPELPPFPPGGTGLPRYGLRWTGPEQPLAVPMADGYWTPAHLAEEQAKALRGTLRHLSLIQQDRQSCDTEKADLMGEIARAALAGTEGA